MYTRTLKTDNSTVEYKIRGAIQSASNTDIASLVLENYDHDVQSYYKLGEIAVRDHFGGSLSNGFGDIHFRTNTTGTLSSNIDTHMIITYEGNVGINTLIPTSQLHVNGDARINSNLYTSTLFTSSFTTSNVTTNTLSNLGDAVFGSNVNILGQLTVPVINYVTSNIQIISSTLMECNLYIESNLGIGTSNPISQLDVRLYTDDTGMLVANFGNSNNSDIFLRIYDNNSESNTAAYVYTTAINNSNFLSNLGNAYFASNVTVNGSLTSSTTTYSSNAANFASNAAYWSSNTGIPWTSNTAVFASNLSITNSNSLYPQGIFASNTAYYASNTGIPWASNTAVFASNQTISDSNILYPLGTYGSNTAYWTSNTGLPWTSNTAVYGSNIAYWTSNTGLPWTSNTAVYGSNTAYWTSNTGLPWTSNTAVFASNLAITNSNDLYPMSTFASNVSSWGSNTSIPWTSNTALFASNLAITNSNTLYPISTFASNISSWASNTSIPWTSNAAIFASNLTVTNSNTLYPRSLFGSNTAYWASNTAYYASNLAINNSNTLYPQAYFASNTAYWSSNAASWGSNTANWSSNTALFASNLSVSVSNDALFRSVGGTVNANLSISSNLTVRGVIYNYGRETYYIEDMTSSTSTSTSFLTKLALSNTLEGGNYMLYSTCGLYSSANNRLGVVQITSSNIDNANSNLNTSSNALTYSATYAINETIVSDIRRVTLPTGSNIIRMQYALANGGWTLGIRSAKLYLVRIS